MRFGWCHLVGSLMALHAAILGMCSAHADDVKLADIVPKLHQLQQWGIAFSGGYIGETLGNTGGIRSGAIYTGRLDVRVDVDLDKLMGWTGATFRANTFQIHGDGLSRSYIGNLFIVSGVEALPASRLYELWIEQSLFGGVLFVRVGQQPADMEFIDSKYDDIFVNSALGWPGVAGVNLPSGGPSPPLAVPGVRLKAQLAGNLTGFLAIFDGDAAPPGPGDPQIKNPNGLLFRVNDPPWIIGQVKLRGDVPGPSRPWSFALGAWTHFGKFDDLRRDSQGLAFSDPASSGVPRRLRGNQGIFGVYEQLIAQSSLDPAKGAGVFMRASISPSDRNLISFYVDGGVQFTGFSVARPDDKIGLAAIFAKVSHGAQQFDRETQIFTGIRLPIRDYEAVIEATYSYQLNSNVVIQPVLQYIFHPGAGSVDPNDPTQSRRIKDAIVVGVRTTIGF